MQKDLKERLARKEEDEEERKVRDDRVRQIRALEKVLHKAETGAEKYDPTNHEPGHARGHVARGLKERLALVKARAAEAVYKRSVIQRDKKEKADDVQVRWRTFGACARRRPPPTNRRASADCARRRRRKRRLERNEETGAGRAHARQEGAANGRGTVAHR